MAFSSAATVTVTGSVFKYPLPAGHVSRAMGPYAVTKGRHGSPPRLTGGETEPSHRVTSPYLPTGPGTATPGVCILQIRKGLTEVG